MRILFLTLYPEAGASSRYRVLQFIPYLEKAGFQCTVAPAIPTQMFANPNGVRPMRYHAREAVRRVAQLLRAKRYDLVVVQKALLSVYLKGIDLLLDRGSTRFVYDFDDAVHLKPPHSLRPRWKFAEANDQVLCLMHNAALVLAGNAWLAQEARNHNSRVELFPTVVDTDRFSPSSNVHDTFRVGWIGNPSTTAYLEPIAGVLRSLRDAEVCLIGAERNKVNLPNAEFRPWQLDSEVLDVNSLCVGLMPLPKTDWARGKCGLKALQYMACGIPCVATPFGAAGDIIEHDVNGLFAETETEWHQALDRLRDPVLRDRLGRAARQTVEERYSLRAAAPRFRELLESAA